MMAALFPLCLLNVDLRRQNSSMRSPDSGHRHIATEADAEDLHKSEELSVQTVQRLK